MRWTLLFLHWNLTNVTVWLQQHWDDFQSYVALREHCAGSIAPTEAPGNVDLLHACGDLSKGVHVSIHLHALLYSSTSPTTALLPLSLSLCLTSHDPLWFHLSWFSTLHFLLKTWFSQSSPVSHPSSSSSVSPPTYLLTPSNPLPWCYSTIWPRWCCLRAHITVLSSLNWNLKRGAFNMVLPGGIPPSTPALLHGAVSRAPLAGLPLWKATREPGKSHKSMNKGSVTLWNTWSWRLMDRPLFMQSLF